MRDREYWRGDGDYWGRVGRSEGGLKSVDLKERGVEEVVVGKNLEGGFEVGRYQVSVPLLPPSGIPDPGQTRQRRKVRMLEGGHALCQAGREQPPKDECSQ